MTALPAAGVRAAHEPGPFVFLFTLAAYQYGLLTTIVSDIRLGSANLQVTIVTLMLLGCAILRREQAVAALGWPSVMVLGLGLVFIPFKMLAGLLHPAGLQGMRLFFILPLIWTVYAAYVTDETTRRAAASIIIWNCVFVAVFGIVHFFFFPRVFFSTTVTQAYMAGNISLIPGHSQEAAFFGNPSAYGAILATGMLVVHLTRRRSWPYVLAFLVMALAAYLSISRSAWVFVTVVLVLYLAHGASLRRPRSLWPMLLLVAVGTYTVVRVPFFGLAVQAAATRFGLGGLSGGALHRVAESLASGRAGQYVIGMRIALRDVSHILLGSPDTEDLVIGGVNFSDNSFIFLALGFGVPLAALWIVTVLRRTIPPRLPVSLGHAVVLGFLYITLFTTPSLGWDAWLVYAVGLLFISGDARWGVPSGDAATVGEPQPAGRAR